MQPARAITVKKRKPMSQTSTNLRTGYRESTAMPQRVRDVLGRLKVSMHQNIYEADFEYGTQPLRWEAVTAGGGSVTAIPSSGGVRMRVSQAAGDITIRQSRPYHRYQPGKTMFMATGVNLGTALAGNVQRVGFFDDQNGVFFEQGVPTTANPYGIYAVVRSDTGGVIQELRTGLDQWNGDTVNTAKIDFTKIQMFWMEYAWYGAGAVRWGFWIDGEPIISHQIGFANYQNPMVAGGQQAPWARTGNLPVRYEQRNLAGTTAINDMYHYGVSVIIEGRIDDQRGFTYSYGLPNNVQTRSVTSNSTRFPLLTIRGRQMGTQEYGTVYANTGVVAANVSSIQTSTSSFYGNVTGNVLTVTATVSGTVANGQALLGFGLPWGTFISNGSGTTWTLSANATITANTAFQGNATIVNFDAAAFTTNQFQGRTLFFPGQGSNGNGITGRVITGNTSAMWINDAISGGALTSTPTAIATATTTLSGGGAGVNYFSVSSVAGISAGMAVIGTGIPLGTFVSNVNTGTSIVTVNQPLTSAVSGAGKFVTGYCIGLINRGQLLPKRLMISSDNRCVVELISGSINGPVSFTGNTANYVPLMTIGSYYSFAERDYNATGQAQGGEVVFAFTLASGSGLQDIDLGYFFPLYNNIRGNQIDTLTVAITTVGTTAAVGGHLICQEAMS